AAAAESELLPSSGALAFEISGAGDAAAAIASLPGLVATPDSGATDATFGFAAKRCGLLTSTGWTSSRATITRVPRFVRCQSRTAKSFVRRMHPCDAGYPGRTPACSAIPDQVMRCM